MLFMIGIEKPAKKNQAFGIVVPVFEEIGYSCFSAADTKEDILLQAKSAILEMAEEAIKDGLLVQKLNKGYVDYSIEFPDFDQWMAIEVPIESIKNKQKRINITLSEPMLARVDAFVSGHNEYRDRSDFLAKAADNLMQH